MSSIDFVILWVDDNDPLWRKKRDYYKKQMGITLKTKERYRSWDNLQYLFRGIEKYASWVNKIFLVTDNQVPEWLDTANPKIRIVDHTEIIDYKYLPVFNSSAIELNVHKIVGLADKFVYFNDDNFITDFVDKDDFFINDVPKDTAALKLIVPEYRNQFNINIYNNVSIINNEFSLRKTLLKNPRWFDIRNGKLTLDTILLSVWRNFTGFYDPHIPLAFNKQTFYDVWNIYEDRLNETVGNKFRTSSDYTCWLFRYWQLASNNFQQRSHRFGNLYSLGSFSTAEECAQDIMNHKYKVICANDNENLHESDFEIVKNTVNTALQNILPESCSFEI